MLIPKVSNPKNLGQFRPISLCNFVYRVISKVLANRLKPLMKNLISPQQSAFIPRRLIQDCIMVAHECFHHISHKKKGSVAEMAIKLDLNKSFDHVEWDFLLAVMNKMGFCSRWQSWIYQCLSTTTLQFLVNDEYFCSINPKKGLR